MTWRPQPSQEDLDAANAAAETAVKALFDDGYLLLTDETVALVRAVAEHAARVEIAARGWHDWTAIEAQVNVDAHRCVQLLITISPTGTRESSSASWRTRGRPQTRRGVARRTTAPSLGCLLSTAALVVGSSPLAYRA